MLQGWKIREMKDAARPEDAAVMGDKGDEGCCKTQDAAGMGDKGCCTMPTLMPPCYASHHH